MTSPKPHRTQRWSWRPQIPSFFLLLCSLSYIISISSLSQASAESIAAPAGSNITTSFQYDIIVYGSTPAAITAALQVKQMGKTVAIVCPEAVLGGLTTSGLGWTDSKDGNVIGGLARKFYQDVFTHYDTDSKTVWKHENRTEYLDMHIEAQPGPAIDEGNKIQWTFEPRVAETIFAKWITDANIPVYSGEQINRDKGGVTKAGPTITSITTVSGKTFKGAQFIDAGYEGDLMATANIQYRVGRDSHGDYGEKLAGVFLETTGDTYDGVDPYVKRGDESSGLLHGIEDSVASPLPMDFTGASDSIRLQSFNYRLCLSKEPKNAVPFTKPDNYSESTYELLLRVLEAGHKSTFSDQAMPNKKTDSNSDGPFSFDFVGGNFDAETKLTYSEASYAQREAMIKRHKDYQMGYLYTMAHSSRIPEEHRQFVAQYGLAKDEFVSNENWPYQLYIREARRMQGQHILTQNDVQNAAGYIGGKVAGMGSYSIDSHVVRRVAQEGKIYNEGGFYVMNSKPYAIPYGAIVPKKQDATNFLNPVTVSASHVGFGSIRMEPTYMVLGQSAAIGAVHAIEQGRAVQDVDQKKFMAAMKSAGQRLG